MIHQPLLTSLECRQLDKETQVRLSFARDSLMEIAGAKIAEKLCALSANSFLFLCGTGNNAGDALVAARHLCILKPSAQISVFLANVEGNDLFKLNLERLKTADKSNRISYFSEINILDSFDCLVDGLFGTGLNRALDSKMIELITWANAQKNGIRISIDVPSGLNATDGTLQPLAFKAHKTYSIGAKKWGFYLQDGPGVTGGIESLEIGFLYDSIKISAFELGRMAQTSSVFDRKHKYDSGIIRIIAGSANLSGAAYLAAKAALSAGAPAVQLFYPKGLYPVFDCLLPEVLKIPIGDESDTFFSQKHQNELLEAIVAKKGPLLIGPGLGRADETLALIGAIVSLLPPETPLILDADALYASFSTFPKNTILTPHIGELSFLAKTEIKSDSIRLIAAKNLAQSLGVYVFSKGLHGFFTMPDQITFVLPYTNEMFRKTGFGDVFAGWFVAQILLENEILRAFSLTSYQIWEKAKLKSANELRPEHLISDF